MISIDHLIFLLFTLGLSETSTSVLLNNCSFNVDLYEKSINLRWSSNDSRDVHLQGIYSLSSSDTLIPGHIYSYLSQSMALIPFFVRCPSFSPKDFLPFTQCSSTISSVSTFKRNYEATRTNLNLKSIWSMIDVPLLYIGESILLLSNCSFQLHSKIYQLSSDQIFTIRIEYESPVDHFCHSCNERTSICHEKTCQCRPGTMPLKLHQEQSYCVDTTKNCSFDGHRCFQSSSSSSSIIRLEFNHILLILIVILIVLIGFFFCLVVVVFYHFYSHRSHEGKSIDRHDRTPSTISTTDSLKYPDISSFHLFNDDEHYPKILREENNGELVLILV